ncbi:MAG TPA: NB-ARC domain-containing protein [Actinokineospora sp.]|nr:NB-ARC domain-containing protein [Actinokineospora sp.]
MSAARHPVPNQIQGRNPHFVNHDEELAEAAAAAKAQDANRVVVLSGPPGVGKSAVAHELAFRVREHFADGALFGSLSAGMDQPGVEADVLHDFLRALGVDAADIPDRVDARRALFQQRTEGGRYQILLDGAVSAAQVRTLLPGDGASLVLVTERRPLSALGVDRAVTFIDLSPLKPEPARELLARLAGHERVAAEPAAVDEVISLCGHLPIALCVVGALVSRSRARTFESVAERLRDERARLSTLSTRDGLSVDSVFTAAYRLLGDAAQLCYRALGMRPRSGEISVAAMAAALAMPAYEVAEAMTELADFRLVEEIGSDRFAARELVRLHAERLDERDESERAAQSRRLLDHYLAACFAADDVVSPGRPWRDSFWPGFDRGDAFGSETEARAWLRAERANLAAAAAYAHEIGDHAWVVRLCVVLWPFYEKEKCFDELFATHSLGVKSAWRLADDALGSLIEVQRGFGHYWLRDVEEATAAFEDGLRLATTAGVPELEATSAEGLGLARLAAGQVVEASAMLERSLMLARRIGDPRRIALATFHLAKTRPASDALDLLAHAATWFAANDEAENLAKVAVWRAKKLIASGVADGVGPELRQALDTLAARGRRFDQIDALTALGELAELRGETAVGYFREALVIAEDMGMTNIAAALSDRFSER